MKIKSDFARRVISLGAVTTSKGMYHAEKLIKNDDTHGHLNGEYYVILFCSMTTVLVNGSIPWTAIGLFHGDGSRI